MIRDIFGDRTTRALEFALAGLTRRQQVASDNIANAETPGFKASAVPFEQQLARALEPGISGLLPAAVHPGHLGATQAIAQPEVVRLSGTTMRGDGNNVDIDREMAQLAETGIRYNAASQLLSGKLALLRAIVHEGRR